MSKLWIKLYHEILNDSKMMRLSDHLFSLTIKIFLIAGENGQDGSLPCVDDIAWRLRVDPIELVQDLVALEECRILTATPSGYIVTKFADRQAPSSSTERWRKWAENKRKEQYYSNEPTNENQTKGLQDKIRIDKNRSDKEADKKEQPAANAAPPEPLTEGQVFTLQAFNAKRFSNNIQRATVFYAEDIYGFTVLKQYIEWAAKKGLRMGDAVVGMERALPKWGQPKNGRSLKEELIANGYTVN